MSDSEEKNPRKGIRGFAKKILKDDETGESALDPKEVLSSLLHLSDKARTETVRLVAKEFRGYLDAMEVKEDLHQFLTSYSLEVKASFRVKPVHTPESDSDSDD